MADSPSMKGINKNQVLSNTNQQTSTDGPARGGNKYNQMKLGEGFMVQKPLAGHAQQKNVECVTPPKKK